MLRYHCGSVGRPPCDATSTTLSPSAMCSNGTVRRCPVFRPVVVTRQIGTPWRSALPTRHLRPSRPPDFRYSQVCTADIVLMIFTVLGRSSPFGFCLSAGH